MERQYVDSSNLLSVGYDRSRAILEIEFKNRRIYQYFNVPEIIFMELLNAPSKGKFFHQHIKNLFVYSRV